MHVHTPGQRSGGHRLQQFAQCVAGSASFLVEAEGDERPPTVPRRVADVLQIREAEPLVFGLHEGRMPIGRPEHRLAPAALLRERALVDQASQDESDLMRGEPESVAHAVQVVGDDGAVRVHHPGHERPGTEVLVGCQLRRHRHRLLGETVSIPTPRGGLDAQSADRHT